MGISLLPLLLLLGIIVGGVLLVVAIIIISLRPSDVEKRINKYVIGTGEEENKSKANPDRSSFKDFRYQLNNSLAVLTSVELQIKLSSAYWPISDKELIVIRIFSTVTGFILGWLLSTSILGGIGLGIFVYLMPNFILSRSIQSRRNKFQNQLLDVLMLVKGSVQAGYSLLQSLDVVVSEMSAPSSEEYNRVIHEVQLGLPLHEALLNLSGRMESDDLKIVVTAININTEVGGNLTLMLDAVTTTIRNRFQLLGEIRSQTSYAKYTATLLSGLPLATGLIIFLINPEYFKNVGTDLSTQLILGYAVISVLLGNFWLRQIIKIDV